MIERVDISLIEKYLTGEIETDQLRDLEGRVLDDAQIAEALVEYKELILHLEGAALKEKLKQNYGDTRTATRTLRSTYWRVAATVLILVTLGLIWRTTRSGPEFNDYFEHFAQLESFRGNETSAYSRALEAYSRRNYKESLALFKQVKEPNSEVYFFMGVSALALERSAEAIEALEQSGLEATNRYHQQTRWYLALAWWHSGDLAKAKAQWQGISAGEYHYDQAQKLLGLL